MIQIYYILLSLTTISLSISILPKEFKFFSLSLLAIHSFISFFKNKLVINKYQILIFFVLIIYPLIITLINDFFINSNTLFGYRTIIQTTIMALASINISIKDDKAINIVMYGITTAAIISLLVNILVINGIVSIDFLKLFEDTDGVAVDIFSESSRPLYQAVVSRFYLRSTLLFIIPAIYFLFKMNYISSFFCFTSIVLSASRTSTFLCVITLVIFFFLQIRRKSNFLKTLFFVPTGLASVLLIFPRAPELLNLWRLSESAGGLSGFGIRSIYINHYFESTNLLNFFFGHGMNTLMYNPYRGIFEKSEISQLNYIFENGIIISLLALLTFILVIKKNIFNSFNLERETRKSISISLIVFFIASYSNIILLHPFFVYLILILSKKNLNLSYEFRNSKTVR